MSNDFILEPLDDEEFDFDCCEHGIGFDHECLFWDFDHECLFWDEEDADDPDGAWSTVDEEGVR